MVLTDLPTRSQKLQIWRDQIRHLIANNLFSLLFHLLSLLFSQTTSFMWTLDSVLSTPAKALPRELSSFCWVTNVTSAESVTSLETR